MKSYESLIHRRFAANQVAEENVWSAQVAKNMTVGGTEQQPRAKPKAARLPKPGGRCGIIGLIEGNGFFEVLRHVKNLIRHQKSR